MVTSTQLILLLLLAAILPKHALCKECTNTPSSSHTIRQAMLRLQDFSSPYYRIPSQDPQLDIQAHAGTRKMASNRNSQSPAEAMELLSLYEEPAGLEALGFSENHLVHQNSGIHRIALAFDEAMVSNEPFLREISLHDVVLEPDSPQGRAQQTNLEYLLMLDVDSLVWSFRTMSNISAAGSPYGGWESPTSELRGHFVGHYMSATALMWASTHNTTLHDKMTAVVDALFECQQVIGTGYLSAFPSEFFDRFEAVKPVWAPYYTIHKIMAGLLDQYTYAENTKALKMAVDMAEYFSQRVARVINLYTIERHWQSLNEEVGGMNDVLYRLYTLTNNTKYLGLAHLFDKPCFLGLLAVQADSLSGFHANTHIPLVVGAQMRFEITGQELYKDLSSFFMDIINASHSYPTGGTSAGEFWTDPSNLGDTLSSTETEESCTTYNMLKVSRHLFRWTRDMRYADYYERALLNGVLSIQRGEEPGVMIYMLPMGKGQSKAVSYHGWGTQFESFWCCYGTGIESFSKLGDSIYFEDVGGASMATLYIIQFVSSMMTWRNMGLVLNQRVEEFSSSNATLHVVFEFRPMVSNVVSMTKSMMATLQIRIPFWTDAVGARIFLNHDTVDATFLSGTFLPLSRVWQPGDEIDLYLPLLLRTEKVKDNRDKFSSLRAIYFGPYLLAGMSSGDWDIMGVDPDSLSSWITPVTNTSHDNLFSFSQENGTEEVVFLKPERSFLWMDACPLEGTNEAAHSTFRLVDPVVAKLVPASWLNALVEDMPRKLGQQKGKSFNPLVGKVLSIELFDQPGSFLTHCSNGRVEIFMTSTLQSKVQLCGHGHHRHPSVRETVFRVVPGLSGHEEHISFEAVSRPGCFMYAETGTARQVRLGCSVANEALRMAASFSTHRPLASYNSISFIAKGATREFLLLPLVNYKDENYTVFFNVTSG